MEGISGYWMGEEVESYVVKGNEKEKYRRFKLYYDESKIVCEKYDEKLCMANCNGKPGYGCKSLPPDFYKGISGYSAL